MESYPTRLLNLVREGLILCLLGKTIGLSSFVIESKALV